MKKIINYFPIYAENNGGGGNFEPAPAGKHLARCVGMIELGTLTEDYQGVPKTQRKVAIQFEFPALPLKVFKEGEPAKPIMHTQEYTLSTGNKAALRKLIEQWRGRPMSEDEAKKFEITKLLTQPCILDLIHKTSKSNKVRAEISGISWPKTVNPQEPSKWININVPAQITPTFEFGYVPFDVSKVEKIPNWLRKKMETSPEWLKVSATTNIPVAPSSNPHVDTPTGQNNAGFTVSVQNAVDDSQDLPF